jgi:hypothetical protein
LTIGFGLATTVGLAGGVTFVSALVIVLGELWLTVGTLVTSVTFLPTAGLDGLAVTVGLVTVFGCTTFGATGGLLGVGVFEAAGADDLGFTPFLGALPAFTGVVLTAFLGADFFTTGFGFGVAFFAVAAFFTGVVFFAVVTFLALAAGFTAVLGLAVAFAAGFTVVLAFTDLVAVDFTDLAGLAAGFDFFAGVLEAGFLAPAAFAGFFEAGAVFFDFLLF